MTALNSFSVEIPVMASDLDFMGHVNNARYVSWVQDVIVSFWDCAVPTTLRALSGWVARKHEIKYLTPALKGQSVKVETVLARIRNASADFKTTITCGDSVLATSTSTWCHVDLHSRRPSRIPDTIKRYFENYNNSAKNQ